MPLDNSLAEQKKIRRLTLNTNSIEAPFAQRGLVVKKTFGQYFVKFDQQLIPCSINSKLRKQLVYPIADPSSIARKVVTVKDIDSVDPIAVGDRVEFIYTNPNEGMIVDVLPRRNKLSRPSVDGARRSKSQPLEQVLAVNIDQALVVMPITNPAPAWNLLDRYLVTTEAAHIPAIICFTKTDLLEKENVFSEVKVYEYIGYPVVMSSSTNGHGIDQVRSILKDKCSVLWGKSGVGKSSLLNAVQPGLGLRVNEVNEHNSEGRHTTTHMEMIDLDFGGSVIDTPGLRQFKLWNADSDDIAYFMPDLKPFVGQCKFGLDCTHEREPGCTIRSAVSAGQIDQRRYESYLEMREYFSH